MWLAQRPLIRTTECLGDRWDGVTNSAVRDVRTPPAVELFCDVGHSCDNIGPPFRLTLSGPDLRDHWGRV